MITKMKFKQLFFVFMLMAFMGVTVSGSAWAATVTLYPSQDAMIWSCTPDNIKSDGTVIDSGASLAFGADAWTWYGLGYGAGAYRGLMQFDLSSIPQNAVISDARLSLYKFPTLYTAISTRSGSNKSLLQRITSPWDEHKVNWNIQPPTTSVNQAIVPEIPNNDTNNESWSTDLPNLDITALVKDMVAGPNYGFMMRLETEQYYRSIFFSSSNATDPNLRPKLVVTYEDKSTNPDSNGVLIDMDISTINYEDINDVESELSVHENDEIWVCVVARGVTDLDTYQVEVFFDTGKLQFLEGAEENPIGGIKNLLKKNGGTTTDFLAVEKTPGTVNISNTLTGADCNQAPEGSGAIALLKFKVLSAGPNSELTPDNAFFVDCTGNNKEITELRNGTFIGPDSIPGDFNTDGKVDFLDLGLLANYWLLKKDDSGWNAKYDLEEDGIINYLDLSVLGDHWLEEN